MGRWRERGRLSRGRGWEFIERQRYRGLAAFLPCLCVCGEFLDCYSFREGVCVLRHKKILACT